MIDIYRRKAYERETDKFYYLKVEDQIGIIARILEEDNAYIDKMFEALKNDDILKFVYSGKINCYNPRVVVLGDKDELMANVNIFKPQPIRIF